MKYNILHTPFEHTASHPHPTDVYWGRVQRTAAADAFIIPQTSFHKRSRDPRPARPICTRQMSFQIPGPGDRGRLRNPGAHRRVPQTSDRRRVSATKDGTHITCEQNRTHSN